MTASFVFFAENRAYLAAKAGTPHAAEGHPVTGVAIGLFLLLIGLVAIGASLDNWLTWQILRRDGVEAAATVLALRTETTDGETVRYVSYRLTIPTPNGPQGYEREGTASEANFARLREGGPVTVMYSQADPSFSRIVNETSGQIRFGPFLLGCSVVLFAAWVVRKAVRVRRRLREGRLLPGRVEDCSGWEAEDGYLVELRYSFRSPSGEHIIGRTHAYRDDLRDGPLPARGTPVTVLFLSEHNHQVL